MTMQMAFQAPRAPVLRGLAAAGLLIWVIAWPRPYSLCLIACAAAPVLAVILAWRGRGQARAPGLGALFFVPCVAVAYLAFDVRLVHGADPLIAGAVLGAAFAASAIATAPRRYADLAVIVIIIAAALSWGIGVLALANTALDKSAALTLARPITGLVTGGYSRKTYAVTIAPTPDDDIPAAYDIDRDFYRSLQGQPRLCIHLRPGALGWRTYSLSRCDLGA
ncbi:hypothetical protein BH11PSE2_BH11PSE2_18770 [soil metagenome]